MMARNQVAVSKLFCLFFCTTLMIQTGSGDIISEPTSQISFEGSLSIFSCHSNGSVFWQINGDLYDQSRASIFEEKGFSFFDAFIKGSEVNKTVSVRASKETNNTVINCVDVSRENVVTISGDATLTVVGSPTAVSLTRVNSSTFRLMWESSSNPARFEPSSYTVSVRTNLSPNDNGGEVFNIPAVSTDGRYTFDYRVDEGLLPLSDCSQLTFSVYSSSAFGDSPPVEMSWELPIAPGPIQHTACRLTLNGGGDTSAYITFTFPRLCEFQRASYSYSVSLADTNSLPEATSETRTYTGGDDRELEGQLLGLKLDIGPVYRVRVRGELTKTGKMIRGSEICIGPGNVKPTVQGLVPGSSSVTLPAEFIVGIVISGLLLLTVLIFNGVLIAYFCVVKRKAKL